ncbi:class E sortase [Streptomyces sp. NPDC015220]|uniref:class E sortase n=1 Tax=Streptomyces sp. NPDC015220 TaxID=3364947 RepID=UPI0036F52BAC
MTALRPERESGADWYGTEAYDAAGEPYAPAPYDPHGSAAHDGTPGPAHYDSHGAHGSAAQAGAPGPAHYDPYGSAAYRSERPAPRGPGTRRPRHPAPADDETMALRVPDPPPAASGAPSGAPGSGVPHEGRAARRKAARGRHGRHGGAAGTAGAAGTGGADGFGGASSAGGGADDAPLSRVEARRRARARRAGPGVVASRVIGELCITTGVVMLLFVAYQLWWTNVRAHAEAGNETHQLQDDWASGKRNPGTFEPGQGFAILHIPVLDVVAPIAEGTSKTRVLDKGMVGHYGPGDLDTAMPGAKTGNFGLAGHRNTHGEPFRYINRLRPGDPIVVETQDTYFVYKMTRMLPVTSPANTGVLDPVPRGSGFTGPGRYITLTTCTPEFTSKYRLIVWGKMVEERPRSKGKPDALVS